MEDFDVNRELTDPQQQALLDLLKEYSQVFASDAGELGRTTLVKHKIVTEGTAIRQPL